MARMRPAAEKLTQAYKENPKLTSDPHLKNQMSEEMKARVSQMASMSASTNQQLDMQEKNLRALQKKNKS